MAKSICYDPQTDLLAHPRDIWGYVPVGFHETYRLHHRAKRSGYVRENRVLMRPYSGRFGVGYILASNAGHGNVWVDYYIKGE